VEIPDYIVPFEGWRKFKLRANGSLLVSANYPFPWKEADPGDAVCLSDSGGWFNQNLGDPPEYEEHTADQPCPHLRCTCGWYSFKTREQAEAHRQGYVLARVSVWGRVAVHRRGYRSSRIAIQELFLLNPEVQVPVARQALVDRYRVPITVLERTEWISENPNVSSSSSLSQSLAYQNHMQSLMQVLQKLPPSPLTNPQAIPLSQQYAISMWGTSTNTPAAIQAASIDPRAFVAGLSPVEIKLVFDEIQRRRAREAAIRNRQALQQEIARQLRARR